jgi:hypothetical protein
MADITLDEALAAFRYTTVQTFRLMFLQESGIEIPYDIAWGFIVAGAEGGEAIDRVVATGSDDAEGVFPGTDVMSRVLKAAIASGPVTSPVPGVSFR